jgi:alkylation response protein AidB-like acyl-CoA dehydrogenase
MSFEMKPRTEPGARLLAAIRDVAPLLSERAEEADRNNQICEQNYRDMQAAGIASAFVPEELGGMGLQSIHDWILAVCALARADGSTAIAMNMHFSATRGMAARYAAQPEQEGSSPVPTQLREVAAGNMLICSTTTESGTDNLHPLTEAVEVEDGWEVTGKKYFVTLSPIATHVSLNVRARNTDGDHIANVLLPMNTPGIKPNGDWDALGMRASGSQSVTFDHCKAPRSAFRIIGPWGQWSIPVLLHRTLANVPLVGAFLGIAEAAYSLAVDRFTKRPERAAQSGVQHTVAEMHVSLATCQCMMSQIGARLDDVMAGEALTWEAGHELMKDYQSVKWVVNRHAIDIVSRAMELFGGGGFVASNPLTRLYRDVRAGPFMQPHSPVDAREYVGRVELGLFPQQ